MKYAKIWAMVIVVAAAQGLWAENAKTEPGKAAAKTPVVAKGSELEMKIKDLADKEKIESGKFEEQINALNVKYGPVIASLEKQLNEQREKQRVEIAPLQTQVKAVHDKYAADRKPVQDAIDLKQKIKDLSVREAQEKKALADKKKAATDKAVRKQCDEDLKALGVKFDAERKTLQDALKAALKETTKK